jgi:hypothetical protein
MSPSRSRFFRAGLAAAAVTATVLAATAVPAFAVPVAVTILPTAGVTGANTPVVASGTGLFTTLTGAPGALFTTSTTCPATFATTAVAPAINATAVKTTVNDATITPPLTLVPNTYYVCVYALSTAGSALASTSPGPTYTVTPATPVLNTTSGVPGAVTSVTATATGTTYLSSATTVGVNFSTAGSCPGTYVSAVSAANLVATTTKTSTSVATITMPSPLLAGTIYKVCVYNGTANGTSALLGSTTYSATAPPVTLSPTTGPSAGGNTITVTAIATIYGVLTSAGVTFSTVACPATYTASPANKAAVATVITNTTASVTVPAGVIVGSNYRVCVYNGVVNGTSALIGATETAGYTVTLPSVVLSPPVGPTGGLNTITATSTLAYLSGVASPAATFSLDAQPCPATYTAGSGNLASTTVTKISNFKVAIKVPSTVLLAGVENLTDYNTCIYASNSAGALIAQSQTYSVAPVLSVSSITPTGGPAQGGSLVEITGAGFPSDSESITATLGGSPLTNIVVTSATTLTGITTGHPAGVTAISVTTAGGTVSLAGQFTFSNGITISPNTAPSTASAVYLDILGVGFSSLTFASGASVLNSTDAHVYLVDGVYDATDTVTGTKDNPPVANCANVLRISDVELICTLDLTNHLNPIGTANVAAVPDGTYTVTVVSDGALSAVGMDQSILSSGATFTVANY